MPNAYPATPLKEMKFTTDGLVPVKAITTATNVGAGTESLNAQRKCATHTIAKILRMLTKTTTRLHFAAPSMMKKQTAAIQTHHLIQIRP